MHRQRFGEGQGHGKEQQIRIQASGGLSDDEIEKMVHDAETHAEEDKKRRAVVDARVEAERQIHVAEKSIADGGDKVSEADKSTVEAAIAEVKSALEGEDADDIKAKTAALAQASMKLGEALYQAAAGEAQADEGGEGGEAPGGEDVVDADFEEVDDDDQKKSA